MKLDSGATKHFFGKDHLRFLSNIKSLKNGPTATLPNGHIVQATHEGTINIKSNLTPEASQVLVFPNLTNESLVSIGQLCDDGCIVLFTKKYAYICKEKKLVATGYRNPFDGLWDLRANANITQQSMSKKYKKYQLHNKKRQNTT